MTRKRHFAHFRPCPLLLIAAAAAAAASCIVPCQNLLEKRHSRNFISIFYFVALFAVYLVIWSRQDIISDIISKVKSRASHRKLRGNRLMSFSKMGLATGTYYTKMTKSRESSELKKKEWWLLLLVPRSVVYLPNLLQIPRSLQIQLQLQFP